VTIDIARQHLLDKIGRGLTATDHQGKAGVEQLVLDLPLEQAGFAPLVPRRRRREVLAGEVCLPFTSEVDAQSQFTLNLSYLTINSLMKLTVQV
jgi:hypothetical protein